MPALPPAPPRHTAVLESARMLSPLVRELVFRVEDAPGFSWVPGQWVSLQLPMPDGPLARAYSIADAPDGTGRFPIAVTHVTGGPGSAYLHALAPGARLPCVGPQGFFTLEAPPGSPPRRASVFVATGTGLAPFRAMIRQSIALEPNPQEGVPLTLLFGVRHAADLLWRSEWEDLARTRGPAFRFEPTLSRPEADWTGRSGYVQTHVAELVRPLVAGGVDVYICGLKRMIESVRAVLKDEIGLTRQDIHTERYD